MLIPQPMPEELALGYFRRLQAINGYLKPTDAINVLRSRCIERGDRRILTSFTANLAHAIGMSLPDFCQKHTLIPFKRAIAKHLAQCAHGTQKNPIKAGEGGVLIEGAIYCCPRCAEEDFQYHGFSYFRRIHQLPGITFCPRHKVALVSGSSGLYGYISPEELLESSPHLENPPDTITDNVFIDNHINLMARWLTNEMPIARSTVSWSIAQRIKYLEISIFNAGDIFSLSHVFRGAIPYTWLSLTAPSLARRIYGHSLSFTAELFDANNVSTTDITVLMSVLFDNHIDAIAAIHGDMRAIRSTGDVIHMWNTHHDKTMAHQNTFRPCINIGFDSVA